jgi:uncharacterized protein YcfL
MRTHILLVLTALIVTACASKREIASTQDGYNQAGQTQHARYNETGASASGGGSSIR